MRRILAALVDDVGAWVAIGVGITVIIGGMYGVGRFVRRQLRQVVTIDIKPALDKLHGCMSSSFDRVSNVINDHVEEDRTSFGEIREWRAHVDERLSDLKDGQDRLRDGQRSLGAE